MKALTVAMVAALACGSPPAQPAADAGQALAGLWDVRYVVLDSPNRVPPPVNGAISLMTNHLVRRELDGLGAPTNYGVYDIDFSPIGLSPAGDRIPAVVATTPSADSIVIQFDSDRPGFAMRMVGRIRGDTIRGIWKAVEARGFSRSGRFTMARRICDHVAGPPCD